MVWECVRSLFYLFIFFFALSIYSVYIHSIWQLLLWNKFLIMAKRFHIIFSGSTHIHIQQLPAAFLHSGFQLWHLLCPQHVSSALVHCACLPTSFSHLAPHSVIYTHMYVYIHISIYSHICLPTLGPLGCCHSIDTNDKHVPIDAIILYLPRHTHSVAYFYQRVPPPHTAARLAAIWHSLQICGTGSRKDVKIVCR